MHGSGEVEHVLRLGRQGWSHAAIARATGIPRTTARDWLHGRVPASAGGPAPPPWELSSFPRERYAYLLGLYLGDGHVALAPRTAALRISFDARYPANIGEAVAALRRLRPGAPVHVFRQNPTRCVIVHASWRAWPLLFPQHGPGKKHERAIVLTPWQSAITSEHPQALVRGLLQSDGCRFANTVRAGGREYTYPRYCFTNRSEDIKAILGTHLDLLGISWRRMGERNVSVARREAVARLDRFVGPKR